MPEDRELARQVAGREWVLGICLLAIANESALTVFDPLWPDSYRISVWRIQSAGWSLLLMIAGACVRPRALGALVAVSAALWLVLDALGWVGLFDVFAVLAPKPFVNFQF